MYAICLSEEAVEILQEEDVLEENDNAQNDTIWFISENEDLAKKVMQYFEKMNSSSEIIKSITIGLKREIGLDTIFRIIKLDDTFWRWWMSFGYKKIAIPKNFICIEGILNLPKDYNGEEVKILKEYHNSHFNYYFLTRIRKDLGEDII
jgi:hypothetical protein